MNTLYLTGLPEGMDSSNIESLRKALAEIAGTSFAKVPYTVAFNIASTCRRDGVAYLGRCDDETLESASSILRASGFSVDTSPPPTPSVPAEGPGEASLMTYDELVARTALVLMRGSRGNVGDALQMAALHASCLPVNEEADHYHDAGVLLARTFDMHPQVSHVEAMLFEAGAGEEL